jgi:hypothetical protein
MVITMKRLRKLAEVYRLRENVLPPSSGSTSKTSNQQKGCNKRSEPPRLKNVLYMAWRGAEEDTEEANRGITIAGTEDGYICKSGEI